MPEYVYALHDFQPENEDEVSFHPGERIEVIEKDDEFGDGWWKGRNLAGRVGLFPQSYTAPAPPSNGTLTPVSPTDSDDNNTRTPLQPLNEESEPESSPGHQLSIIAPIPQAPPNSAFLSGNDAAIEHDGEDQGSTGHKRALSNGSGEMMKATITDVQKAIEQLGRGNGQNEDGDGSRSFSFASSRDEQETDTDYDMSDVDGVDADGGQGWHKGARRKLAAKARKAVEEAEKLEAMLGVGVLDADRRPPIDVELSDESEDEDGEYTSHSSVFQRGHPHIPEEEEEATLSQLQRLSSDHGPIKRASNGTQSTQELIVPDAESPETQYVTATVSSFPALPSPYSPVIPPATVRTPEPITERAVSPRLTPARAISPAQLESAAPVTFPQAKHHSAGLPIRESITGLPSPTGSFQWVSPTATGMMSKHSSASSKAPGSVSALSQVPVTASSMQNTLVEEKKDKDKPSPSEWSVEEVIDWLKGKGFDQEVQDKFIEQEITGDVLLELDVNLLKSEIGIMAFGKRMRIANAITDLRRPPSIIYTDPLDLSQTSPMMHGHSPLSPHSFTHSRNQSQQSHSYSGTVQSSLGHTNTGTGISGYIVDSPQQDFLERSGPIMDPQYQQQIVGPPLGLGIGFAPPPIGPSQPNVTGGKPTKGRPAQLMLSPSDGALKNSANVVSDIPEEGDEDKAVQSENEAAPSTMRRRIFGRQPSSSSKGDSTPASRHSKDGLSSMPVSPAKEKVKDKEKDREKEKDKDSSSVGSRQARSKKSLDGSSAKGGERLSIFGASFSGTLGKSRKPPPRYSTSGSEESHPGERGSVFSMARLGSSSGRKGSSQRPVTPNTMAKSSSSPAEVKEKDKPRVSPVTSLKEKEMRDASVLRKRTSSAPPIPSPQLKNGHVNGNGANMPVKEGKSILDQIGEPDHSGWMRKKGERYNSWKMRYFVLKGDHMYWLKSNHKTETKVKGFINIVGYKVTYDENVDPGRYGFRIEHDQDKTHYFSSDEKAIVRDWMKAIMKATISRDYTKPVVSSCNIPTIPLTVAQAMNPAPRPPSPTARDATQKALRRENPNKLSTRDARILMGLTSDNDSKEERTHVETFFSAESAKPDDDESTLRGNSKAPPRPSREHRKVSVHRASNVAEENLINWANTHLPPALQMQDTTGSLCGGLALLRLAESIKGHPCSPPIPDSAFPVDPNDDKIEGLFKFFDFLIDNEVKIGTVSINDVRQGNRDKILQIMKALKAWEDKHKAIAQSIGPNSAQGSGFMSFT